MLRAGSNSSGKGSFIAVSLCIAQTVPLAEQSSRLRGATIDASSVTKDREGTRVWRFGGWGSVGEARGDTLAAGEHHAPLSSDGGSRREPVRTGRAGVIAV